MLKTRKFYENRGKFKKLGKVKYFQNKGQGMNFAKIEGKYEI